MVQVTRNHDLFEGVSTIPPESGVCCFVVLHLSSLINAKYIAGTQWCECEWSSEFQITGGCFYSFVFSLCPSLDVVVTVLLKADDPVLKRFLFPPLFHRTTRESRQIEALNHEHQAWTQIGHQQWDRQEALMKDGGRNERTKKRKKHGVLNVREQRDKGKNYDYCHWLAGAYCPLLFDRLLSSDVLYKEGVIKIV